MAPAARPAADGDGDGSGTDEEDYPGTPRGDRKSRKPLVEKKRRARINESLRELRTLLADADFQSKMENAEVLEMTVRKVEDVLKSRTQESDVLSREASERFAAGYIQCMHEVHMFVSSCPGIDATVAAELLNHLLECMPLNEDRFQDALMDFITDTSTAAGTAGAGGGSTWSADLASPPGGSPSALSPTPSTASSEDLSSDLEETDSEPSPSPTQGVESQEATSMSLMPTITPPYSSQGMWRPW